MSEFYLLYKELPIDENSYKPDMEVLKGFQSFSSELVRLSLISIAIVGFFYEKIHSQLNFHSHVLIWTVQQIINRGLILLVISAAFALSHRFLSTNSMAYQVSWIRYSKAAQEIDAEQERKLHFSQKANKERKSRNLLFKICRFLLGLSAAALGLGVLCLLLGFINGLKA